jgi:hypothetical protein
VTATTDLVPDVIDYLVTACQSNSALAALGVTVFDGPQPSGAASGIEQVLWVGHNPKDTIAEIGSADQAYAFVGDMGATRDETGEVVLCAKHWTGDLSFKLHRDGCKAITGAVELMLRGLPATGGPGDFSLGGLVFWAQMQNAVWWQSLADGGAEAYCAFKVSYSGRLVSV